MIHLNPATRHVLGRLRDRRNPALPRKARVFDSSPTAHDGETDALAGCLVGAALSSQDLPVTSDLIAMCGGDRPAVRVARLDTLGSYEIFRSSAIKDLSARVDALEEELHAHEQDPHAHESIVGAMIGAVAEAAAVDQERNSIPLSLPPWAEGKVIAWRDGDLACASILLPGGDGEVRVCSASEPIAPHVDEVSGFAAETMMPEEVDVVGIGCVLGAATAIKEMAAGAHSILGLQEAKGKEPFYVELEHQVSPGMLALLQLLGLEAAGDVAAAAEVAKLASEGSPEVRKLLARAKKVYAKAVK